jgi:hypothetical protein
VYGLSKFAEQYGKGVANYVAGKTDNNISVQDPVTYSRRFVRFLIKSLQSDHPEENNNTNINK